MRTIGSFESNRDASIFSHYLKQQGIQNIVEVDRTNKHAIWVYEEEQLELAANYYSDFTERPDLFKEFIANYIREKEISKYLAAQLLQQHKKHVEASPPFVSAPPIRSVTAIISLLCIALFFMIQSQLLKNPIADSSKTKIEKALLYDYPRFIEIKDDFANKYPNEELRYDHEAFKDAKFWPGLQRIFILKFKHIDIPETFVSPPLCEKIQEGEIWRIFTPIFLHRTFVHLLLNILWFIYLGQLVEKRVGMFRFFLFCAICAIGCNTAQYFVSGWNFNGLSGIVCGLFGFIWARQKYAAWELYPLSKSTSKMIFVLLSINMVLEIFTMFSDIILHTTWHLAVANTSHLIGAFLGIILGKLRYFQWRVDQIG